MQRVSAARYSYGSARCSKLNSKQLDPLHGVQFNCTAIVIQLEVSIFITANSFPLLRPSRLCSKGVKTWKKISNTITFQYFWEKNDKIRPSICHRRVVFSIGFGAFSVHSIIVNICSDLIRPISTVPVCEKIRLYNANKWIKLHSRQPQNSFMVGTFWCAWNFCTCSGKKY